MKKSLLLSVLLTILFASQAQTRYLDEVFPNVQITDSVVYAQNFGYGTNFTQLQNIVMDIYQPAGDVATNRPVVLLSHNGSFLPEVYTAGLAGLCFNGLNDSSLVELCKRFARRGYVAVCFDYRLGWNPTAPDQITRTKTIIQAVYRAMQDSKSCIRYFKNSYANGNPWGIDTSKFVLGGTNSGAYVALAASSMNDPNELLNIKFQDINGSFIKQDSLGDFNGFGGFLNHDNYAGISSKFQCVLSLGGAVGDTSWIQPGETPIIAFQGANESGTPYNTAVVTTTTNQPVIEASGSGDFMPYVEAAGNNNAFLPNNFLQGPANINGFGQHTVSIEGLYPFYGQYFEPWNWYDPFCYGNSQQMQQLSDPGNSANWASAAKGNRYIDTIMMYTLPRLYKLFIDHSFTGIRETNNTIAMSLFPNPANSSVTISVDGSLVGSNLIITDITGRKIMAVKLSTVNCQLSTDAFSSGIYFASIQLTDGTQATRKLLIEK